MINQPVLKHDGVVAVIAETVSLKTKSVSQSSPTAKANRNNFSSSFRLDCILEEGVSHDLTLALPAY